MAVCMAPAARESPTKCVLRMCVLPGIMLTRIRNKRQVLGKAGSARPWFLQFSADAYLYAHAIQMHMFPLRREL